MDNFFKSLKDNLEHRPEVTFQDAAWGQMQAKMRAEEKRNRVPAAFLWWTSILALLLLASTGLNYYWYKKAQGIQHTTPSSTLIQQRDTIYQTRIIYQTDTVYQTQIKKQKIVQKAQPAFIPSFSNLAFAKLYDSFKGETSSPFLSRINSSLNTERDQPSILSSLNNYKTTEPITASNTAENPTHDRIGLTPESLASLLTFLHYPSTIPNIPVVEPKLKKKKLAQLIYPMRPKALLLGVNGGLAFPFAKDLESQNGYALGIKADISFSESFRIFTDFSYLQLIYNSDKINESIGVPEIDPPSDNFIFKTAQVAMPSLQYSIELKYLFQTNTRFKPYIGLGLSFTSRLPYEIVYDFDDPITGIEISRDLRIDGKASLENQWLINFGLDYKVNKKWSWQVNGFLRNAVKKTDIISPNIIGLRTGVFYKL